MRRQGTSIRQAHSGDMLTRSATACVGNFESVDSIEYGSG